MSKLKKAILIVFTMLFIMNLQVNTSLTQNMNGSFSLTQLVENVFFPNLYAEDEGGGGGNFGCADLTGCGGTASCNDTGTQKNCSIKCRLGEIIVCVHPE